jgi:hypothetical protein
MRSFRRPAFEPPSLTPNGVGGKTAQRHIDRYSRDGARPQSYPKYWRRPDVLGHLLAMQYRICAYCGMESKGLEVDHFRP